MPIRQFRKAILNECPLNSFLAMMQITSTRSQVILTERRIYAYTNVCRLDLVVKLRRIIPLHERILADTQDFQMNEEVATSEHLHERVLVEGVVATCIGVNTHKISQMTSFTEFPNE